MDKLINVYEVLRVIDNKPLFLEEHFNRFEKSLKNLKVDVNIKKDFYEAVLFFIKKEKIKYGNIRIDVYIKQQQIDSNITVKQLRHKYPDSSEYEKGVKVVTYPYSRLSPQNKIWNAEIRKKTDFIINQGVYYEVLYYDKRNYLTEGSRSNLFFIKGSKIFTPKASKVLQGVTRNKIFEIAQKLNIEINELNIHLDKITFFETAFITGTSPKILPISYINNVDFNVKNKTLRLLMEEFDNIISKNISKRIKIKNL